MAEESVSGASGLDDLGLDAQQIREILAQTAQRRAAQVLKEAREQFDREKAELQQQIDALRQLAQEQEHKLTNSQALLARETARCETLDQELAGLRAELAEQKALNQSFQQIEQAITGLEKNRSDLLQLLQRQREELNERLNQEASALEASLAALTVPAAAAGAAPEAAPVAVPVNRLEAAPPPAAVPVNRFEAAPPPPAPTVANVKSVLERAREITAPRADKSTTTLGMAEIQQYMNGARLKKAAAESAAEPAAPVAEVPQDERRRLPRRGGNPVPVMLETTSDPPEAMQALVLDRSQAGVGLRIGKAQAVGTVLKIRAGQGNWVQIEVRNCVRDGNSYRVGCQFTKRYPWAEIQQFG